jgi:hypothetical protein
MRCAECNACASGADATEYYRTHGEERPLTPFDHHHHCSRHPRSIQARRYHLLRSATAILCGLYGNDEKVIEAVTLANELLAEVERREHDQA